MAKVMDLPAEIADKLILAHRILAVHGAFELTLGRVPLAARPPVFL